MSYPINTRQYLKFEQLVTSYQVAENKYLDRSKMAVSYEQCSAMLTLVLFVVLGGGAKVFNLSLNYLVIPGAIGAFAIGNTIASFHLNGLARDKKVKRIAINYLAMTLVKEGKLKCTIESWASEARCDSFEVSLKEDKINAICQDPAQFLTVEEQVQVHNALNGVEEKCSAGAQSCSCKPACQPLAEVNN